MLHAVRTSRRGFFLVVVAVSVLTADSVLTAQTRSRGGKQAAPARTEGPADYRSRNFLVHTDLQPKEAEELLIRLETMLGLVSRYWGRPNRKTIECYVVKDLKKWPPGSIDPEGAAKIAAQAGVTKSVTLLRGGRAVDATAVVYAYADRGVPQHEAVHAYCAQAFGDTGPVWYSEGMAEMGQYWRKDNKTVQVDEYVEKYLQDSEPKSLNAIVNGEEFTGDSWQNYAWRWALCHMLATSPNYSDRFRTLGLGILQQKPNATFENVYGAMAKEISFEYLFFLEHMKNGYRADLCAWDWKTKYKSPRGRSTLVSRIEAGKGWQASRVLLHKDQEYDFAVDGKWKIAKDGKSLTADGDSDGAGKLMGVVFNDYELSEPFELGAYGTFKAPSDGNLLLRSKDDWGALGDNTGRVTVRVRTHDADSPLPKPE